MFSIITNFVCSHSAWTNPQKYLLQLPSKLFSILYSWWWFKFLSYQLWQDSIEFHNIHIEKLKNFVQRYFVLLTLECLRFFPSFPGADPKIRTHDMWLIKKMLFAQNSKEMGSQVRDCHHREETKSGNTDGSSTIKTQITCFKSGQILRNNWLSKALPRGERLDSQVFLRFYSCILGASKWQLSEWQLQTQAVAIKGSLILIWSTSLAGAFQVTGNKYF